MFASLPQGPTNIDDEDCLAHNLTEQQTDNKIATIENLYYWKSRSDFWADNAGCKRVKSEKRKMLTHMLPVFKNSLFTQKVLVKKKNTFVLHPCCA